MDRKYQIFVSSPQRDLKDEREAVVKAILRLGHIPVGMEMFNAADESSWKLITRYIDESDFYVVVLAHRYGSLDGEISFTEKEYDYAISKEVPTFGFIIDPKASWSADLIDKDPMLLGKLTSFKEKVARKQVDWWATADQLSGQVLACLATQIPLASRPGWVRGSTLPGPAVADEISRLSRENAELRAQAGQPRRPMLAIRLMSVVINENGQAKAGRQPIVVYANMSINLLDGRPTSIPLDLVSFVMRSQIEEISLSIYSCSGLESEGKFGNGIMIEISGPRLATLTSNESEVSLSFLNSERLDCVMEMRQLGYQGSYHMAFNMCPNPDGNPHWILEKSVEAEGR